MWRAAKRLFHRVVVSTDDVTTRCGAASFQSNDVSGAASDGFAGVATAAWR